MSVTVSVLGVSTSYDLPSDGMIGDVLPEPLREAVRTATMRLVNAEGLTVTLDYSPAAEELLTVWQPEAFPLTRVPRYDVVANKFGETVSLAEYHKLREVLTHNALVLWDTEIAVARERAAELRGEGLTIPHSNSRIQSAVDEVLLRGKLPFSEPTWPYAARKNGSKLHSPGAEFIGALADSFERLGRIVVKEPIDLRNYPDPARPVREATWGERIRLFQEGFYHAAADQFEESEYRRKVHGIRTIPLWTFDRLAVVYHPAFTNSHVVENSEALPSLDAPGVRVFVAEGTAERDTCHEIVSRSAIYESSTSIEGLLQDIFWPKALQASRDNLFESGIVVTDVFSALHFVKSVTGREAWEKLNESVNWSDDDLMEVHHPVRDRSNQHITYDCRFNVRFLKISKKRGKAISVGIPLRQGDVRWQKLVEEALSTDRMKVCLSEFRNSPLFMREAFGVSMC